MNDRFAPLRRLCTSAAAKSAFALDIDTVPLAFLKIASPEPSTAAPIVFLHGLCGNKKNNRASARVLAKELARDVYCVDLRNHGDSPHSNRHDTAALASDVEDFIAEHRLHRPVVVGHSMGAKAAMAIPLRRPHLVSAVVSVDNAPQQNVAAAQEFRNFKTRLQCLQRIVRNPSIRTLQQADYLLSGVEPSKPVRMFMLANLYRSPKDHRIHSAVPLQILIDHLDSIQGWEFGHDRQWPGPALLVKALQSPFVDDYSGFRQLFPNGLTTEIDSGHWVITERNKAFNDVCIDFIRSLG